MTYELFPFSFQEFLSAREIVVDTNLIYGKTRHRISSLQEEYLLSGGYPEVTFISDKSTKGHILQDYFNAVFYRDLKAGGSGVRGLFTTPSKFIKDPLVTIRRNTYEKIPIVRRASPAC